MPGDKGKQREIKQPTEKTLSFSSDDRHGDVLRDLPHFQVQQEQRDLQRAMAQSRQQSRLASHGEASQSRSDDQGLAYPTESRDIKREQTNASSSDNPPFKRKRGESLSSDTPAIKQEPGESPERLAPAEGRAPNRAPITFNDTHTRWTHENRTFYFSRPLDFFNVTENQTSRTYGTDNPDRLQGEIGNHLPWERVDPPSTLAHEQLKLYTPLYTVKDYFGDGSLSLFDRPETLAHARPDLHLNRAALVKAARGGSILHRGFSSALTEDRQALRNDGVPLQFHVED